MKLAGSRIKVLIFFLIFFASVGFVMVWFDDLIECQTKVISEKASPDGTLTAFVYGRTCGSSEGYTTHVSLLKNKIKKPSVTGNILVSDSNHNQAPSDDLGIVPVQVDWLQQNDLTLSFNKNIRIFRSKKMFKGIKIKHNLQE